MLKKEKKLSIILISLISIITFLSSCSKNKNYKKIAIIYEPVNSYYDNELKKDIINLKFNKNLNIKLYTNIENNKEKILKNIEKENRGIVILENRNLSLIKSIYKYCRHHKIILNLISNTTNSYFHNLFITDYYKLGYQIGKELYNLSRKKRNIFIIFFQKNYKKIYYKNMLLKGFSQFNLEKNITLITNYYKKNINEETIHNSIKNWINEYGKELRGIFIDNDNIANISLNILRRSGKDNEIKIASFGTTLEGINSMLKIGLTVDADENRISLFTNAIEYNITNKYKKYNKNRRKIIYIPGVIYNQQILLDKLAKTKKFSIKQLIDYEK